jgi:hypothetical protein
MITTNYNYFHSQGQDKEGEPYLISNPIKADAGLQRHLFETLDKEAKDEETEVRSLKLHASADCFCQCLLARTRTELR